MLNAYISSKTYLFVLVAETKIVPFSKPLFLRKIEHSIFKSNAVVMQLLKNTP